MSKTWPDADAFLAHVCVWSGAIVGPRQSLLAREPGGWANRIGARAPRDLFVESSAHMHAAWHGCTARGDSMVEKKIKQNRQTGNGGESSRCHILSEQRRARCAPSALLSVAPGPVRVCAAMCHVSTAAVCLSTMRGNTSTSPCGAPGGSRLDTGKDTSGIKDPGFCCIVRAQRAGHHTLDGGPSSRWALTAGSLAGASDAPDPQHHPCASP